MTTLPASPSHRDPADDPDAPDAAPRPLTAQERLSVLVGSDVYATAGVEAAGLRGLTLLDGPHGVRAPAEGSGALAESRPATCFPTAVTLGSTWNPELMERIGAALGAEAAAAGADVLLGPGANLKRTPLGGRNFEYFSEDPMLSAAMASAWIRGVQGTGVGASIKHFVANDMEQRRYGIDVRVDERALRELYLRSFEQPIVHERPATVMAAYSKLNGTHCTESRWLLQTVLRDEWGFEGIVVSDWGASWDGAAAVAGGTDLSMPGPIDLGAIEAAVRSGAIPHKRVVEASDRVTALMRTPVPRRVSVDHAAHHELARQAAAEGMVLLKNDRRALPLTGTPRIALIGAFAEDPRYEGGGSSHVNANRLDTLSASLTDAGVEFDYAPGYDRRTGAATDDQLEKARRVARDADVAIVVVGLPEAHETEGLDRSHMRLPDGHNQVIDAAADACPQTIIVLMNGSPVEMPWADRVPAILEAHLGGQAGGSALADVLRGLAEPGGRLAETAPERYEDHPASTIPVGPVTAEYRESVYLGYRYFDSAGVPVAFPFGHGLSYTTFHWSDVQVSPERCDDPATMRATVSVRVTNTGTRAGSEVVQVYVHDESASVFRPRHELAGFRKVWLEPGEEQIVTVPLDRRAFSFWNTATHGWSVEPGRFEIRVGASSRDIRGTATILLDGPEPAPDIEPALDPYWNVTPSGFTREAFAALAGPGLPSGDAPRPGEYTIDTALRDMQGSWAGRTAFRIMRRVVSRALGVQADDPLLAVANEVVGQMNFRMLPALTRGRLSPRRVAAILRWLNRHARWSDWSNRNDR